MSADNLFKHSGWSIVVNKINGELYIYRADCPGEMIVRKVNDGYMFEAYAHADKLVNTAFTGFDQLDCPEA